MAKKTTDVEMTSSPTAKESPDTKRVLYSFPEAIGMVMEGYRMTRLEWRDEDIYMFINAGRLQIHWNEVHDFLIRDVDMFSDDWYPPLMPVTQ